MLFLRCFNELLFLQLKYLSNSTSSLKKIKVLPPIIHSVLVSANKSDWAWSFTEDQITVECVTFETGPVGYVWSQLYFIVNISLIIDSFIIGTMNADDREMKMLITFGFIT